MDSSPRQVVIVTVPIELTTLADRRAMIFPLQASGIAITQFKSKAVQPRARYGLQRQVILSRLDGPRALESCALYGVIRVSMWRV